MKPLDRRELLGGAAAAGVLAWTGRPSEDPVRLAVVGLGERGREDLAALEARPDAEVVALCDVDESRLAQAKRSLGGRRVPGYVDLRDLLERDDVEAVVLATPDHWHALQAVWSCEAGKDVFVEPPLTHHLDEEFPLRLVARQHDRVVCTGLPGDEPFFRRALEWLDEGHLGLIRSVQAVCFRPRRPIGEVGKSGRVPDVVDYDLWTGPAPLDALRRTRLHYDWRFTFATGGGEVCDGALPLLDLARRLAGEGRLTAARVFGGRFGPPDDGETPNTLVGEFELGIPVILEVRGLPQASARQGEGWEAHMDQIEGLSEGLLVGFDQGNLHVAPDGQLRAYDLRGEVAARFSGSSTRWKRFLRAVRQRGEGQASLEAALAAGRLAHAANLSFRRGERTGAEQAGRSLAGESPFGSAWRRMVAHLERNGVEAAASGLVAGRSLSLDDEERPESPEARELAAGTHRAPYRFDR